MFSPARERYIKCLRNVKATVYETGGGWARRGDGQLRLRFAKDALEKNHHHMETLSEAARTTSVACCV